MRWVADSDAPARGAGRSRRPRTARGRSRRGGASGSPTRRAPASTAPGSTRAGEAVVPGRGRGRRGGPRGAALLPRRQDVPDRGPRARRRRHHRKRRRKRAALPLALRVVAPRAHRLRARRVLRRRPLVRERHVRERKAPSRRRARPVGPGDVVEVLGLVVTFGHRFLSFNDPADSVELADGRTSCASSRLPPAGRARPARRRGGRRVLLPGAPVQARRRAPGALGRPAARAPEARRRAGGDEGGPFMAMGLAAVFSGAAMLVRMQGVGRIAALRRPDARDGRVPRAGQRAVARPVEALRKEEGPARRGGAPPGVRGLPRPRAGAPARRGRPPEGGARGEPRDGGGVPAARLRARPAPDGPHARPRRLPGGARGHGHGAARGRRPLPRRALQRGEGRPVRGGAAAGPRAQGGARRARVGAGSRPTPWWASPARPTRRAPWSSAWWRRSPACTPTRT